MGVEGKENCVVSAADDSCKLDRDFDPVNGKILLNGIPLTEISHDHLYRRKFWYCKCYIELHKASI